MTVDLDALERAAKTCTLGLAVHPWFVEMNRGYCVAVSLSPEVLLDMVERIRTLEALAQPLLDAGLECNEPYWSEEEDVVQTTEWWPVPGAARRALWRLRK